MTRMRGAGDGARAEAEASAQLGLLIARADLGYVRAAIEGDVVERGLTFLQHAVLVAYEAHAFCTRQLGIAMPDLLWDAALAAASRTSGKFFDDKHRDIEKLAGDIRRLTDATRASFREGRRRRLARLLGIHNPDLAVLSVHQIPVATSISLAFHAGTQVPGPSNIQAAERVVHDLATGVGQIVAVLGLAEVKHSAPAGELDSAWVWGDGDSQECYSQAFSGDVPERYVPLLLLLQNAVATAASVATSNCCNDCRFAAFKHRLVVAHHAARSLAKLNATPSLNKATLARVRSLLDDPGPSGVLRLRSLRNGLVHLGLSDVPREAFAADNQVEGVIMHYTSGQGYADVDALVSRALTMLNEQLTQWLLEPPDGGIGFAGLLRPPPTA
ncbi:hypothetical protein AB0K20_17955 [Micromonospora matsumotoense]|uniref:hypothetical protein n=1 Tax=Micromonospora matsumotoense TaxID=121616 RepID=UPI0034414264